MKSLLIAIIDPFEKLIKDGEATVDQALLVCMIFTRLAYDWPEYENQLWDMHDAIDSMFSRGYKPENLDNIRKMIESL